MSLVQKKNVAEEPSPGLVQKDHISSESHGGIAMQGILLGTSAGRHHVSSMKIWRDLLFLYVMQGLGSGSQCQ